MNKRNRRKTVRPQNEKAARSFRKKQNMRVELNKKWLPVVYVVMLGICIILNVTNDSLDMANVLISVCMFAITGGIFVYAYKHLKHIDQMGEDFHIAISYIKGDYAKEKQLLWELYRTETRYGIFNEEHLRNSYVDYIEEMKRLENDEEGRYACDIEDFINYQLIDDAVEKGRLSLVPGAMTGLGILGTFIGLSIGLQAFNTGSAEEITNSIGPLMDGIKVAFHTSIYGMIFSLTFNLIFKTVLEQAYHNKELAYQSEIKYLQAQINPHFLYNSFYHLYRMAKMEDTDGIAEMSLKLSSYYRYITRSAQPVVTLAMEYQNIVDYTEIQTIRFGDRITVQLQPLPEPYRELAVPRFILQPLFENAYNHGVEKMENGLIQLRFKMKPEFLNIYVENNGSCPDAELEKLTQYLNSTDRKAECTALKNVKLRMQMQGGDLQVSHGTLGGFGVSLRLPLHPAHSLNTEQQNGQPQKEETSHADTVACG